MSAAFKKICVTLLCIMSGNVLANNVVDNHYINESKALTKIKNTNNITLGVQENKMPFSFYKKDEGYKGYSIDVCLLLIEDLKLNNENLKINILNIEKNNEFNVINDVDLICSDLINNEKNRKNIDFLIPHYILQLKPIITQNNKNYFNSKNEILISQQSILLNDYKDFIKNEKNKITIIKSNKDVLINNDNILLIEDYLANQYVREKNHLRVGKEAYVIAPIAVAIKKEDVIFKEVLNKSFVNIIKNGKLIAVYNKWFNELNKDMGVNLSVPVNEQLADILRYPTGIVGN